MEGVPSDNPVLFDLPVRYDHLLVLGPAAGNVSESFGRAGECPRGARDPFLASQYELRCRKPQPTLLAA